MSDLSTNESDEKTEPESIRDLKLETRLTLFFAIVAIFISVIALILQRTSDVEQNALQAEQFQFERDVQSWAQQVSATDSAEQDVIHSTMEAQAEAQILLQRTLVASQQANAVAQQTQVAVEADLRRLYERSEFPFIRVIETNTEFLLEDIGWESTNNALIQWGRIGILIENEGGGSTILTNVHLENSGDNGLELEGVDASAVSSVHTPRFVEPISSLPLQIEARSGVSLTVQWAQTMPRESNDQVYAPFGLSTLPERLLAFEGRIAAVAPSLVLSFSNGDQQRIELNEADLNYSPLIRKLPDIIGGSENVGGICLLWKSSDGTELVEISDPRSLTSKPARPNQCYSAPPGQYELLQAIGAGMATQRRLISSIEIVEDEFHIVDLTEELIGFHPPPPPLPTTTPIPSSTALPYPAYEGFETIEPLALFLAVVSLLAAAALVYLLPCIRVRTFGKPPDGYLLICRPGSRSSIISLQQVGRTKCHGKITVSGDSKKSTVYCPELIHPAKLIIWRSKSDTVVAYGKKQTLLNSTDVLIVSAPDVTIHLSLDQSRLRCD